MSIFEILMLLCFGFAWPFSIAKSFRSRSTNGKSITFLFVVLLGYFAGIAHKVAYSRDAVIICYILNAAMVSIDIILYYRNYFLEKKNIAS